MNIMIFDTETTSLEKPFCYNIGYVIIDTDTKQTLVKKDFVVEQIWHNTALFASAYYADKRPLYVSAMRSRKATLKKFGYICQEMIRDIEKFEILSAYAYSSNFDEKVFAFNCDWFKTVNPFDNIPIFDIRGYVHHFIAFTEDFQNYCEKYERFTSTENYSTTAETLSGYLNNDPDFEEAHTALADSEIEAAILLKCLDFGAKIETNYKAYTSIKRVKEKSLEIFLNGEKVIEISYNRKTVRNNKIYLAE